MRDATTLSEARKAWQGGPEARMLANDVGGAVRGAALANRLEVAFCAGYAAHAELPPGVNPGDVAADTARALRELATLVRTRGTLAPMALDVLAGRLDRIAGGSELAGFAVEVFRVAGGDTECEPRPTPERAMAVLRDLRACYDEALAKPEPPAAPENLRARLRGAIADAFGDTYVCGRVWEAWGYGTMGPDDFTPASECDVVLDGVVDAALAAAAAPGPQATSADWPPCPECREGVLYECVACSSTNYPRGATQPPDGHYLASFKRGAERGCIVWWRPDSAGYSTDLAQAGVYAELVPDYHDSAETVPVPTWFIDRCRVRRVVDRGDELNSAFWTPGELRGAIAKAAGERA